MKTYKIIHEGKVIGIEKVGGFMNYSAVLMLLERLGYPIEAKAEIVTKKKKELKKKLAQVFVSDDNYINEAKQLSQENSHDSPRTEH